MPFRSYSYIQVLNCKSWQLKKKKKVVVNLHCRALLTYKNTCAKCTLIFINEKYHSDGPNRNTLNMKTVKAHVALAQSKPAFPLMFDAAVTGNQFGSRH